jgi:hypothetical protein
MAVQAAGRYGILLEALKCPKWEKLKERLPKNKPIKGNGRRSAHDPRVQ